jgi:hypothetical protein
LGNEERTRTDYKTFGGIEMIGTANEIEMIVFEEVAQYEVWKIENWKKYILDIKFSSSFNGDRIWVQILVIFTEPIDHELELMPFG